MRDFSSLLLYKKVAIGALILSFLCLIFALNAVNFPHAIMGMKTSLLTTYSYYTMAGGLVLASYCYYRYDHGLYALDLTDEDVQAQEEKGEFEATPNQYKRDKARKARKLRQRRKSR